MKYLLIMILLLLPSCKILDNAADDIYTYAKHKLSIGEKPSEDSQPIDSIVIKFDPAYWKEPIDVVEDDEILDFELDTVINGYHIWILETDMHRRNEVRKLDTVIYIYKK